MDNMFLGNAQNLLSAAGSYASQGGFSNPLASSSVNTSVPQFAPTPLDPSAFR
jgi:hypothetical protein